MRLRRVSNQFDREPSIVPLVNIVFLLLIFFMLVGQLTPPEAMVIQPPVSSGGRTAESQREVIILIAANGSLALNETEMEEDLLLSTMSKWISEDPSLRVEIKADAKIDAVRLIRMMEFLRDVGVKKLSLLTERPQY